MTILKLLFKQLYLVFQVNVFWKLFNEILIKSKMTWPIWNHEKINVSRFSTSDLEVWLDNLSMPLKSFYPKNIFLYFSIPSKINDLTKCTDFVRIFDMIMHAKRYKLAIQISFERNIIRFISNIETCYFNIFYERLLNILKHCDFIDSLFCLSNEN